MNIKHLTILAIGILALTFGSCSKDEIDPPVAEFYADYTEVYMGEPVYYYYDYALTDVINCSWSFPGGDPQTSSLKNPTVVYNSPGTYSVTLTVSNEGGTNTQTKSNYINVLPANPIADFSVSSNSVLAGEMIELVNISKAANPDIITYIGWYISTPDGYTEYIENIDIVQYIPYVAGYYDVEMIVRTIYGEDIIYIQNCFEVTAPGITFENTTPSSIKVEYENSYEYISSGESVKVYDTDGDLSITYKITTVGSYGLELNSNWETMNLSSGSKTVNFKIDSKYFYFVFDNQSFQNFNKIVVNAGLTTQITENVYISWIDDPVNLGYYNLWSNTEIQAYIANSNQYIYWNNIQWNNYGSENIILNLVYDGKKQSFDQIPFTTIPKADKTIILK